MVSNNIFSATKKRLTILYTLVFCVFLTIFSISIYSYFYGLTNRKINNDLTREMQLTIKRFYENSERLPSTDITRGNFLLIWKDGELLTKNYSDLLEFIPAPEAMNNSELILVYTSIMTENLKQLLKQ